ELTVITITVLGGISIFGGSGTMVGAVLALVLVGVLRFGMGLLQMQGQVQDIVIGSLLIVSILLPTLGRRIQFRLLWQRETLIRISTAAGVIALFAFFFFWSREFILSR